MAASKTFLPYLWGIETGSVLIDMATHGRVFTLPMRHWNKLRRQHTSLSTRCFYPTYEALKQTVGKKGKYGWGSFYPTYEALKRRYWTFSAWIKFPFLPYLWGIETSWEYQKKIKRRPVFTLPMRHWNHFFVLRKKFVCVCFYPTYEALKHLRCV